MPVCIRAIRQTSPERVSLELDSGEEIKATLSLAAELRLFAGKALEDAELESLRASAALSLCKARAVELLSYRPMSAKELRDKLTQKGESPEAAASAVDWLCEKGLLDDGRYAGMVVRHYAAKGYGQSRVRQELQRRGVSRELWEEALRELPEPEDKLDAYLASKLKDPDDRAQVQKVSAALIRRGFSWEEIRAALARYRDGMEE